MFGYDLNHMEKILRNFSYGGIAKLNSSLKIIFRENLRFLLKFAVRALSRFFYMIKNSKQKFKYLKNEKTILT